LLFYFEKLSGGAYSGILEELTGGINLPTLRYLQGAISVGFIACIALYIYLMVLRTRKTKDVDLQIWVVIGVGLLLSMAGQYLGILQGINTWSKVGINIMVSAALVLFAGWMIYKKLKGPTPKPPQAKKPTPKQQPTKQNKQGKTKKK
jgi:hypothetical protein